jgi:two-component system OmpR family response regulator
MRHRLNYTSRGAAIFMADQTSLPRRPKVHILVVEDDAEVATFLVLGLREAGHSVEYAGNSKDALSLAQKKQFDMMILDRMLPGGADGADILTSLRDRGIDTPALFLSGLGELSDWVHGLQAGGDDYLVKPVSMAELLPRIEAIRQKHTNDSEAAPAI